MWGWRGVPEATRVYRSLVFQGRVRYPKRPVLGLMGEPCNLLKHKARSLRQNKGTNKTEAGCYF